MVVLLSDHVNYDASWRCSTHMHINMLDFNVQQIVKFLLVYTACEPYLFEHAGQYRRSSNFCTPVGDSMKFHRALISQMHDEVIATRGAQRHCNKYTALNLQPLFGDGRVGPLGTVEFRGGRPMTTMTDLLIQANLLLSIKEYVRASGEQSMDDMLISLGSVGVQTAVFPSGCASSFVTAGEVMEESLINSWVLLKSYQQGMVARAAMAQREQEQMEAMRSRTRSHAYAANPFEGTGAWGDPSPQVAPAVNNPNDPLNRSFGRYAHIVGVGSAWVASSANVNAIISDRRLRRLAQHLGTLCDGNVSSTRKAAIGIRILQSEPFNYGTQEARCIMVNWLLHLNADSAENNPVGTILRAGARRAAGSGSTEGMAVGPNAQFRDWNFADSINLDYNRRVTGAVSRNLLTPLINSGPFSNRPFNASLYRSFANSLVRLKNREALANLLEQNAGIAVYVAPEMTAVHAYFLFRMANVESANHVFRSDLNRYDTTVTAAKVCWEHGCVVPLIGQLVPGGSTRTHLMANHQSGLGIVGSTEDQTHEPRTNTYWADQTIY